MKTCMVWDRPGHDGELPFGAHIGTQVLHSIVPELGMVWWPGDRVAAGVGEWDAYIVNLFEGMEHVTQIKAWQPGALVVALPDAYFDEVFTGAKPEAAKNFMRQLAAADVIGFVSESNAQFYAAWGKPMVRVPIAIGTDDFFDAMRRMPKDGYLLTVDHSPRAPDYTIQNVAACAMIQRETGIEVVYVNAGAMTRGYAEALGLRAEWRGKMEYEDYCRMAARARIGVDMHALHGFGRNELTLMACGTPCVSGNQTQMGWGRDAWDAAGAAEAGVALLANGRHWEDVRRVGVGIAQKFGFEAARDDMQATMQKMEAIWRSPVCS